ncbi:hypothetical protein Tco_1025347 [Tanacetum coccineum]
MEGGRGKKVLVAVAEGRRTTRVENGTAVGEAFSIARIMEARFETLKGKKLNIEEKIDIVLSWPSEEAPPMIKVFLDANEDIGVVEVSSAIDNVFDIGESNVESMKVCSEFSEFLENKESVEEVVVGGGEACGVGEDELNRVISALKDGGGEFDGCLDEINLNLREELADNGVSHIPTSLVAHESSRARQLWERIGIGDAHGLRNNGRNHKFVQLNVWEWMSDSQWAYSPYHLEGKVIFEGVGSVTAWVAEGGRMVLCYVQGSGRRKRKKGVGCGSRRQENYGSGRRDCGRIRIWVPESRYILDITLRTRLAPTTLGEAFSIARIIEARFETIKGKKLNIKEKIYIVLSWPSEEAPPVIKVSLDANEDIGVVEVSSAIDDVFDIGESNVESMEVRSKFSEFSENKESVEEVVVGGGEACEVGEDELNKVISALKDGGGEFDGRSDEKNLNLSEELAENGASHIPTSLLAHESS